jgi:hypothetical protein
VEFEFGDDFSDRCNTTEEIKFPQTCADWNIMKNIPKKRVITASCSLLLFFEYAMAVVVRYAHFDDHSGAAPKPKDFIKRLKNNLIIPIVDSYITYRRMHSDIFSISSLAKILIT